MISGDTLLTAVRGSSEHGLLGQYFRGKDFAGEPVLTRIDPKPDFRWDRGSPTDEPVARGELVRRVGRIEFVVTLL